MSNRMQEKYMLYTIYNIQYIIYTSRWDVSNIQKLWQNNVTVGITRSDVIQCNLRFPFLWSFADFQGGYQILTSFGLLRYRETLASLNMCQSYIPLYRNAVLVSIEGEQRDSWATPDFELLSVEYCTIFCNRINRTVCQSVTRCSSWSHSWSSASIACTIFSQKDTATPWCNWKNKFLWSATDMSPQGTALCASICFAVRASSACHSPMNVAAKLVIWNERPLSAFLFIHLRP